MKANCAKEICMGQGEHVAFEICFCLYNANSLASHLRVLPSPLILTELTGKQKQKLKLKSKYISGDFH